MLQKFDNVQVPDHKVRPRPALEEVSTHTHQLRVAVINSNPNYELDPWDYVNLQNQVEKLKAKNIDILVIRKLNSSVFD